MKTLVRPHLPPLPRPVPRSARYNPHLPRYLGLSLLLGVIGLNVEYQVNGTLLLRPAYRWMTGEIPGMMLSARDGAYTLDFRGTQLDWRLERMGAPGRGPDFELLGYPSLRLTAWRRADPGPDYKTPPGVLEEIESPLAYQGRLLVTPEHEILGAFPIGGGFALLRFQSVVFARGPEADSEAVINDIRRIAASFRSPQMRE